MRTAVSTREIVIRMIEENDGIVKIPEVSFTIGCLAFEGLSLSVLAYDDGAEG